MNNGIITTLFGNKRNKDLKHLMPILHKVNAMESWAISLPNEEFSAMSSRFREQLKLGKTEEEILPEAFALAREAARRTLGERPYDVQILGAIVLHQGKITEMKTGEGKTLASIAAAYLNSLSGKGVHIVTVNDYLAERDSKWMEPVYSLLGVSVGTILPRMDSAGRVSEYQKDITYATNNELGFDYLRDNMVINDAHRAQRRHHFAIIDEIDSILIDEARTPLIISGAVDEDVSKYILCNRLVSGLSECEKDPETGTYPPDDPINGTQAIGDYKVEEKSKRILFTNDGMNKIEAILMRENMLKSDNLFDEENFEYIHYFTQALKARKLFLLDKDYVIQDGQVQIVDEFTGRILHGRRYSDGLHQAIEAKEKIRPARKNRTLATITFQNFFRMYEKLSGMTGTAETESREFGKIYTLDVVVIPTNRPVNRLDNHDIIYLNEDYKFKAICEEITQTNKKGQPILIGTASVEKSEKLSKYMKKRSIKHEVLNAKNHHREALIIAEAGAKGSVTIATNMAGRGTDIKLGGNPEFRAHSRAGKDCSEEEFQSILKDEKTKWQSDYATVKESGGLYIIGTERHESRRIDNQLRGRSGRQGDPGKSQFYISLEDDLMRLFGGENFRTAMARLGMAGGEALYHPLINRSLEKAQKRVEERNYDIRKHLLEYDDVVNRQRQLVYKMRNELLAGSDNKKMIIKTASQIIDILIDDYTQERQNNQDTALSHLSERLMQNFNCSSSEHIQIDSHSTEPDIRTAILKYLDEELKEKCDLVGEKQINMFISHEFINQIDRKWQEHLEELTALSDSVRLRSYAQKNPLVEYKNEGFELFEQMLEELRINMARMLFKIKFRLRESRGTSSDHDKKLASIRAVHASMPGMTTRTQPNEVGEIQQVQRDIPKVGRNEPCPCGSGKKYKLCHGK